MGLEDLLRKADLKEDNPGYSIAITFNKLEKEFTDESRFLVLHSNLHYQCDDYKLDCVLQTIKFPYQDAALGFLINNNVFASLGEYRRAPGIVIDTQKTKSANQIYLDPKIDIVTSRNTTLTISNKNNGIQITFRWRKHESVVPIGVFLKALSGLPYSVILDKIAFKSQPLLNGFPCSIDEGRDADLSKVDIYDQYDEKSVEPSIEQCVNKVYNSIGATGNRGGDYSVHWKMNRIASYLESLNFKSVQNYEASLSLASRITGTYSCQDFALPIFEEDEETHEIRESVYRIKRNHYFTVKDSMDIARHDIHLLRVRSEQRSYLVQEDTPVLFRAVGYKLAQDLPELHALLGVEDTTGILITNDILTAINELKINYLDVFTPKGRKTLHRSNKDVTLGDFITIINLLCTCKYINYNESTMYEVQNRIILDYDSKIVAEAQQTYREIANAVSYATDLEHILQSLPKLPSVNLCEEIKNPSNKEIVQADITNIMARAISDRKSSALMPSTPDAMMQVQKGQYGRLDALHSPDSDKVGSVQHMTILARINAETGSIEAPYEVVEQGKPTGKIVYLSAADEVNKYIAAWNEDFKENTVHARYNDSIRTIDRMHIDYRDPSPFFDMSVSRACIPFPEFSQGKRAIMAAKMNGQAIPVLHPERPLVSTGADTEIPALYYTGRDVLKQSEVPEQGNAVLVLVQSIWNKTLVTYRFVYGENTFTFSLPFTATAKESLYNYNLNLNVATPNEYKLDDIVFYNQSCDLKEYDLWIRSAQGALPLVKDPHRPSLALGVNLRMAYKTYGTSTVDDAVLISDRLVTDTTLSSIQIIRYEVELKADETFDDNGRVSLYSHVYPGQALITIKKARDGNREGTKELLAKQYGEVVYIDVDDIHNTAEFWVSTIHNAEVGDKVAGRYGNKSVIAKIVPEYMMPYDPADGKAMDIICSPLGLPSRMNFGQVLEVALGAVMDLKGQAAIVTPFYPNIKQDIMEEYTKAGLKPKRLFNPVYGKYTERPVMVGMLYFMKLEQMANLKDAALGYPVEKDAVYGEPVKSMNRPKGQAIGEYESWALNAAGATRTLNNLMSFYAGDETNRKRYFDILSDEQDNVFTPWDEYEGNRQGVDDGIQPQNGDNINALATQVAMRMCGLDLEPLPNSDKFRLLPINMEDITIEVEPQNIDAKIAGTDEETWYKAKLASEVINPFWVESFPLGPLLGIESISSLVKGNRFIKVDSIRGGIREEYTRSELENRKISTNDCLTGISAVIELLKNTTIEMARDYLLTGNTDKTAGTYIPGGIEDTAQVIDSVNVDVEEIPEEEDYTDEDRQTSLTEVNTEIIEEMATDGAVIKANTYDLLQFLRDLEKADMTLKDLVWSYFPILPRIFRKPNRINNKEQEHPFQVKIKSILSAASSTETYKSLKEFIGYGEKNKESYQCIRGYFFGAGSKSGKHGTMRGDVLSKRVGFSGRTVITPAQDLHMSPFFIGLPWGVALVELSRFLAIRLRNRASEIRDYIKINTGVELQQFETLEIKNWETVIESLSEFNPYQLGKFFDVDEEILYVIYNHLRDIIRTLVEGDITNDGKVKYQGSYVDPTELSDETTIDAAVVIFGRQPTLHKKSLRSYFVKLVDGHCTQIHPVVCKGYNADFDGDAMWTVQLFGSMKVEACKTISVLQDLISEKDGSYTLELSQDVALGIYCATTFKDNALAFSGAQGDFMYFDDIDALRSQLEYGDVKYYQAVLYKDAKSGRYYCSTAGRILVNAMVPGYFTDEPFTDPEGIASQVLDFPFDGLLSQLRYDCVWTTTNNRPSDRPAGVKLADILLETYDAYGARESVMTTQRLYEVGVVASDVYSVSITLNDMHVDTTYTDPKTGETRDIMKDCMERPANLVKDLDSFYRMGLVTEDVRHNSAIKAWEDARRIAQAKIIDKLSPESNTYYMMYSGARGKPAQIMQTVGFVGTISKTTTEDIETPILTGYGQGLSSLDLAQTRYSARIGVISTQAGTKDTGYATRQSVYMTSGFVVSEENCSEHMPILGPWDTRAQRKSRVHLVDVVYGGPLTIRNSEGNLIDLEELKGDIYLQGATRGTELATALIHSGNIVDDNVLQILAESVGITLVFMDHKKCTFSRTTLDPEWKEYALEELYSYALPYTESDMKITEKSLEWVEKVGLTKIVAFPKEAMETEYGVFHLEAYLPVLYDTSRYQIFSQETGKQVSVESLYALPVDPNSDGYYYYERLLDTGHLTPIALDYLTKKRIPTIRFIYNSGDSESTENEIHAVNIHYELSKVFKGLTISSFSEGLPYLADDGVITEKTLQVVEELQLNYIPVYTGVTCLSTSGMCSRCAGRMLSTRQFPKIGTNLGIPASQAMCEPLSQATLNVGHSGGQRGAGTAKLSGQKAYTSLLKGKRPSKLDISKLEKFADSDGYIETSKHDSDVVQLVNVKANVCELLPSYAAERLNVPNGAFVNKGDTIIAGTPDITRYDSSTNIYQAAINTRLMLIREYAKIFAALDVSPKNVEILTRAQTSNCYAIQISSRYPQKIKDTAQESIDATGNYIFRVSTQIETVLRYTGVAAFAFEDVAKTLRLSVFNQDNLRLTSFLGNLVTGTDVGSKEAKFLPKRSKAVVSHSRVAAAQRRNREQRARMSQVDVEAITEQQDSRISFTEVNNFMKAGIAAGGETRRAILNGEAPAMLGLGSRDRDIKRIQLTSGSVQGAPALPDPATLIAGSVQHSSASSVSPISSGLPRPPAPPTASRSFIPPDPADLITPVPGTEAPPLDIPDSPYDPSVTIGTETVFNPGVSNLNLGDQDEILITSGSLNYDVDIDSTHQNMDVSDLDDFDDIITIEPDLPEKSEKLDKSKKSQKSSGSRGSSGISHMNLG